MPCAELNQSLLWLSECERSLPETITKKEGMEDYRFYAGKQDSPEVLAKLAAQKRPASTYNEVKPKIDMLEGLAAQTKHEPQLLPVGNEDQAFVELMTNVMKHYRKQLKISRRELECFVHMLKCGRSLLHFWIDNSNPYEPKIKTTRFATYNFYIDPNFKEYSLEDARFLFLDKWLDSAEIASRFGMDKEEVEMYSQYAGSFGQTYGTRTNFTDMPIFFNEGRRKYRLVENWYYMWDKVIWFINPMTGKPESLCPDEFEQFKQAMLTGVQGPKGTVKIQTAEQLQPVASFDKQYYYRIFSGSHEYESGKSPFKMKRFPSVFFGAYNDEDENVWFSVIRMMKDPQKALNTMRRQLSHLLQTLPKGILAHEAGAILNIEEYEKRSAEPNFHLETIQGGMDRFKFITQPPISPIYQNIEASMSQSMKDASGIQNEMMGVQTSSREPGVTVRQRQETGLAVLYSLFNNFKESRIAGDEILMSLIQQYVTSPTVIRIAGQSSEQLVQLNTQLDPGAPGFNDITAGEFDVAMSEQIESASQRQVIAEILTDFSQNNPGTIPPELILEYLDAPLSVKQKIQEYRIQQQEAADAQRKDEMQLRLLELEIKAKDVEYKGDIAAIKQRSNLTAKPAKKGGK